MRKDLATTAREAEDISIHRTLTFLPIPSKSSQVVRYAHPKSSLANRIIILPS